MIGPRTNLSRRTALKRLGVGTGAFALWPYLSEEGAAAFLQVQTAPAAPAPVFLSPAQYATVELVAETIIPADDRSPGAKAARVAAYIDLLLSESDAGTRQAWLEGLTALDQASRQRFGAPFVELTADRATMLLTDLSRNEITPKTAAEQFFARTKDATIRGYYTSQIGIHQELQYKGNQFLAEFVGCTHPEHGYDPSSK